ncbi:MAG TPA: TIGR03435 family protein [Bryobacteraceae bacterium]|jgi:uncharacterized protein (TIGR03435 family)
MRLFFFPAGFVALALVAFSQSPSGWPRFEVASVKPGPPGVERASMVGGPLPVGPFNLSGTDPGRITWTNMWLERMIQVAYDFPVDRISGPDWLKTERYDIVATIPMGASISDFRLMVQNLLAERFKLAVHRETKEVSGYVLDVSKSGLKIAKSNGEAPEEASAKTDAGCSACNALMTVDKNGFPAPRPGNPLYPPGALFQATIAVNGRYRMTALNSPMSKIAEFLGNAAGMPTQDRTGLSGNYDVHLEYLPRSADLAADPGADVLDSVQAQLGLKMIASKVPVEMLVIDHAEKVPTAN